MFPGFPNIMMGSVLTGPTIVPSEHFKAVTYTGTGATRNVTGVGFEPDFVWIKGRSSSVTHNVYDRLRGINSGGSPLLDASTSAAEITYSGFGVTDTYSDGFEISGGGTLNNNNTADYVAWCLKAGGAGVTNTDGSLTSTVSANVEAGFSIVKYTGTLSNGTIGHGLNSAPEFVLCKTLNAVNQWHCGHTALGWNSHIHLDLTNTASGSSTAWNTTAPDNSVVNLGTSSGSNNSGPMVAYCFHSVPGFSKVGSYSGSASSSSSTTENNFIELGFRPAFLLIKGATNADNWIMLDNARDTDNTTTTLLYANTDAADTTHPFALVDFDDTGFTLRGGHAGLNLTGNDYIYLAFAA